MQPIPVPDPLKADVPPTTFGKVLAATPVVMTVIATLLAGLASSEMTSAQYDRSLAAQQQSKAGDQWSYFQAKRLRSALQQNALEIVQATAEVHPLDLPALKAAVARIPEQQASLRAELLALVQSQAGEQALAALTTTPPPPVPKLPLEARLQAAVDAVANSRPDGEIARIVAPLKPEDITEALRVAQNRVNDFDAVVKPLSQTLDGVGHLLSSLPAAPGGKSTARDFTVARLRFEAQRYDAEARLNQAIGNLHDVEVHLSNFTAERHSVRSQRFFYGMLIAQAAVIVATLAMAAKQRNVLWSLAAAAGLGAIAFAIYVYLWV